MPMRSVILPRSMTSDGEASRCFITGIKRVAAGEIFQTRALGEQRRGFVDRGGAMVSCLVHVLVSLSAVNGVPHAIGCRRHLKLVVADRVGDGVDDGGRCADRAGLAAALDAERIARTQRRGVDSI